MMISVIIPVHNMEKYLPKTIESIVNQTFSGEYEVIIVDDGSTDESLRIAKSSAESDSRITVIHQDNFGVSVARNTGLGIATGKFVIFIDGDDIMSHDAIEQLLLPIQKDESIILVSGNQERISTYSLSLSEGVGSFDINSSKCIIHKLLLGQYNISACAKLFIRDKIGSLIFMPGKRVNEDKYFLFKYLLNNDGCVADINRTVYGYYVRSGSTTNSSFSNKTLDMLFFSELIEKDIICAYGTDSVLYFAGRYNNLITHLAVLKKMIRSRHYDKSLFRTAKKNTLNLWSEITRQLSGVHKMELIALRIGIPAYSLCVRIYDKLSAHKK